MIINIVLIAFIIYLFKFYIFISLLIQIFGNEFERLDLLKINLFYLLLYKSFFGPLWNKLLVLVAIFNSPWIVKLINLLTLRRTSILVLGVLIIPNEVLTYPSYPFFPLFLGHVLHSLLLAGLLGILTILSPYSFFSSYNFFLLLSSPLEVIR